MAAVKIMVVDDDSNICELLRLYLGKEGYSVLIASNGQQALDLFETDKPDLILLDIMMPELDGWQVCRRIRKTSQCPILMLTAKGELFDKVLGLELGADDYLAKPFHLLELTARIRSVARRQRGGQRTLRMGNVVLDPESRRVTVGERELPLLGKEFRILNYFMQRPNHLVDKALLAESVWGDHADQADTFHFVYGQIKNLRRKLTEAGADIEIRAVYGFGYKLTSVEQ